MEIQYKNVYDLLNKGDRMELNIFNDRGIAIRVLHWQPQGTLVFDEQKGISCQEEGHDRKTKEFISLLIKNSADIGIAPEYCVSWDVLKEVFFNDSMWPPKGKLWCFGMAGISSQGYIEFRDMTKRNYSNVDLFSEDPENMNLNRFFSCLAYLFVNEGNLICVIQFKTTAASDEWMQLEAQGLSFGSVIYYFKDERTNHCLFSFICADVLYQGINEIKNEVSYQNCIILHPQLNPKPLHETFSHMRNNFLGYSQDITRIISVNWSKNTKLVFTNREESIEVLESYSACYYSKALEAETLQKLVLENKKKGMEVLKDGYTYIWYMPDNEHCMQYLIDCFNSRFLSNVIGNHREPKANNYWEYETDKLLWVNGTDCGRCNVDWDWLKNEFGLDKCQQGNCAILKLHKFFSILFGGQFDKNIVKKKGSIIFQQDDKLEDEVVIKRERGAFINRALKDGNVPIKFNDIKNGNYQWILDEKGNFIIEENKEPICIVYADSKNTIIIERRIMEIQEQMGEAVLDRMLLYYLTEQGIKYYEKIYNTEINDPNLTHPVGTIF